ncbi:unnamed protein product, partial [Effrenium voratum]
MSHEPSQGWRRDVVAGHQAMDTTGGSTWDAAHRLCDFLEAQWGQLMADEAPRAVELGAGTGWLGMTLARNVATAGCVCLTEQASGGAMEWLEQNLSANVAAGLPLEPVQLQELDWSRWAAGEPVQLPQPPEGSWDLLIGSDLIYSQAGVQLLPRVLRSFAEAFPQLTMLYCHTLHRFDDFDLEFCREIRQQGLQYRVVAAEGAARPAEAGSDLDPLEELFPEKRVVVFQISLSGDFLDWSPCLARTQSPQSAAPVKAETPGATSDDVVEVGRIRVLLPSAQAEEPGPETILLRLVNLGPFGSGQHPTTALMLQAMQDLDWSSISSACDFGCGSGILGLSALRLGARSCLGVDNVPEALTAAQQNAEANDCLPRLRLHLPPLDVLDKDLDFYTRYGDWRRGGAGWTPLVVEEEFDLVLANIVVGPLCRSAGLVRQLLKPHGQVFLAGMKQFQQQQVEEAYEDFELKAAGSLDGWALLQGRLKEKGPRRTSSLGFAR